MPSRILPMEEIEQLGSKFWLPAGGHDNGVEAKQWTVIAELEGSDVPPVLAQLAAAGVGGHAAAITGLASRGNVRHRLYVDALRYNEALDALMVVLRGRQNPDLGGYVPTPRRPPVPTAVRPSAAKIALRAGQWLLGAAVVATLLAAGYESVVHRYAPVHPQQHHEKDAPVIHQPSAVPSVP